MIILLAIAIITVAAYLFAPEINKPSGGNTFKTIVKEGIPERMQWYKTDAGFHFLLVFDDGYIVHSSSIFFGSVGKNYIKLECKPVNDNMCTKARLLKMDKPIQGQPHQH